MQSPWFFQRKVAAVLIGIFFAFHADAAGIYRNGIGARSMALGGADVAWAEGPLGALEANPASLGILREPTLELGLVGAMAEGRFRNSSNHNAKLQNFGAIPEAAFATPLGDKIAITLGVVPEAALISDWRYVDAPGGLDGITSYGLQTHRSEILVLRSGIGIGVALNEKFSIGGGLGLIYNENNLDAPYIFQTQPVLKGFKTLLDLESSGFGWNGHFGILFKPITNLQFGATYKSATRVNSKGSASGNAQAQLTSLGGGFAGARPDFHYDAEVINHFPQIISGGVSWQPHSRWRISSQIDWINWRDAFDQLPVKLSNGNNADFNGLVGFSSLTDYVPLRWRDQIVYRGGVEFAIKENFHWRGGYSYAKSPVPNETLTPLTAAIAEHTLTTGLGYQRGRYTFDVAYQWDLPTEKNVKKSELRAGEYSNSTTQIGIHWIGITTSVTF